MQPIDHLDLTKAQAFEASENNGSNPFSRDTLGDMLAARMGRRRFIQGSLAVSALSTLSSATVLFTASGEAEAATSRFNFAEIQHGVDETHHVASGYAAEILIRWGDPVEPGAPEFNPYRQTAAAQEQQFGYNNDYIGYTPLPYGTDSSDHALLCINHEYTNEEVMFPGTGRQDRAGFPNMTREKVAIEMAAHGGSVIEVKRNAAGKWEYLKDSPYNRRISARSTPVRISGPAAGHKRLRTSYDPTGELVIGTLNNCAGGMTPWGTYLMAEENFNGYFWGDAKVHPETEKLKRYGAPGGWYAWGLFETRFNINKEPNEVNRFGWIVEVDPYNKNSQPIKRTALGRFKHEGAETILNKDGRVVVYSGDDQRFDYLYKFVSKNVFNPNNREANLNLLDEGTLYVARFSDKGWLDWLPLIHGQGPLTAANGFESQADVLIDTRLAADVLGATPMDRPEDVTPNPKTNKIYVMLTNNSKRKADDLTSVNPRAKNIWGHIVEISPQNEDHAATQASWNILVKCGDPSKPKIGAMWNSATSKNGWFASPDNCTVDNQGRLWITTDQGDNWKNVSGTADGIWVLETEGEQRGAGKMFFRVPVGAEMCGPMFNPDDSALFVAVQHPGTDGTVDFPGFERISTFEDPATRWPDFDPKMPPRPSVLVITKTGGGKIG